MSLADIENEIASKQKELQEVYETHNVVEQAWLTLKKQIHDLQGQKKDMDISLGNSQFVIKKLNLEIRQLTAQFWSEKNG